MMNLIQTYYTLIQGLFMIIILAAILSIGLVWFETYLGIKDNLLVRFLLRKLLWENENI